MDAMSTVLETRIRHNNLVPFKAKGGRLVTPEEQAKDPRYGYVLGVLYMRGAVTDGQHEAGKRYAEDMARYFGLCGYPFPSARAQNLFAIRGGNGEGPDRTDEAVAAREKAQKLRDVVLLGKNVGTGKCAYDIGTGRKVAHVVNMICLQDSREVALTGYMVSLLKRGLNALAKFYVVDN